MILNPIENGRAARREAARRARLDRAHQTTVEDDKAQLAKAREEGLKKNRRRSR